MDQAQLEALLQQEADAVGVFINYFSNTDGDSLVVCCDKPDDLIATLKANPAFKHTPSNLRSGGYFKHEQAKRLYITVVGEQKVMGRG